LPSGWALGSWPSPKNLSTHQAANVSFTGGFAVLSLTSDTATGFAGSPPPDSMVGSAGAPDSSAGAGGGVGAGGAGGAVGSAGAGAGGAAGASSPPGDAAGAGPDVGGAGPTNVAGASAVPPVAPRPSSDSRSSQCASSPARSGSAGWLTIAGGALIAWSRRRGWGHTRHPGARG
jgi:hypothetical protein